MHQYDVPLLHSETGRRLPEARREPSTRPNTVRITFKSASSEVNNYNTMSKHSPVDSQSIVTDVLRYSSNGAGPACDDPS